MIDIHAHILPGIDDGAKEEEDLLEMARSAVADGITDIIATPHHMNGVYVNPPDHVLSAVAWVNARLEREAIPIRVHPGQEVTVHEDFLQNLRSGSLLPLGGRGRYVLIELRDPIPESLGRLLYEIRVAGYVPIIAHAERYQTFLREPNRLYRFVKNGALAQATAGSFLGHFGKEIQKWTYRFMAHRLIHFIASDAHKPSGARGFHLRAAYRALVEREGGAYANFIKENAHRLLSGKSVTVEEPEKIEKRWIFFR